MHNASFGDHMASWFRLEQAVANNAAELSHLQRTREALARAQREAEEARRRQAVARAAAQQATRDLEAAMARAHAAATKLRSSLWGHYGRKSIKLIEFGMRPYAPARKRDLPAARWGGAPQRGPATPPPVARPGADGATLPGRGRHPLALGRRSPTARGHAAPAHNASSPWGTAPQRHEATHPQAGSPETTIPSCARACEPRPVDALPEATVRDLLRGSAAHKSQEAMSSRRRC